jgi:hypothetical protein
MNANEREKEKLMKCLWADAGFGDKTVLSEPG